LNQDYAGEGEGEGEEEGYPMASEEE